MQYFLWYLVFLPFLVPRLSSISTRQSIVYGAVWFCTQVLWLSQAYRLEFFGRGCILESVGVWADIYGGTLLGVGRLDGGVWESLSVLECYGGKVINCRLLILMFEVGPSIVSNPNGLGLRGLDWVILLLFDRVPYQFPPLARHRHLSR